MKKTIPILLILSLLILFSNITNNGEILQESAIRVDDGCIYISDEYIALSESISNIDTDIHYTQSHKILQLVNEARTENGLPELTWSKDLAMAASIRAEESSELWSHTRPDGSDWWTVNSEIMYGENLAKGYILAEMAFIGWMNSPTHKANILDKNFKTLGVYIYQDANGVWYWAQEFGY